MSRCPTCGNTYPNDANFCTRDGTRLLGAAAAPADTASSEIPSGTTRLQTAKSVRADRNAEPLGHSQLVGSTLQGRYEIVRKVGEGGMSFVYLANDVATK